jgi:hypothetical protein
VESVIILQALAGILYLLTVTIVGCRLLMLARRTRQQPELLLAGALLLGGTLAGPLEAASAPVRAEIGHAIAGKLLLAGKIAGLGALICHLTFIRRVFRPHQRWAGALVALLCAFAIAALFGYGAHGAFGTEATPKAWFWLDLSARLFGTGWLTVEGAIYYGMMKRRLRLGLAEPIVTNRFLLWTLAGTLSVVILLTSVPPTFLDSATQAKLLTLDLLVFSIAGIAISGLYLLTFLPPARYRRWISETSGVAG